MKLLLISLMFSVKIVTSQDEVTETIEDNIVVEEGGSGDIEDVCDDEEGSGEAEAATLLESADYTMSGVSGLTINIGLEWYTDSSVKINCDMEDLTAGDEEDGSGDSSFRASLSSFPSKLFLIKDLGVCNDLGTAVGNDITADALELASVSGPGSASETLSSVTWAEVKESHCMAMLKQNQEASEDDDDGEVVVDRAVAGARQCRRRFSILRPAVASARIFAPINLAAFSLVSVGVTSQYHHLSSPGLIFIDSGAFAISAGIPAVVAAQSSNIDNNNFWDAESVYTAAPFIALAGIYWLTGYPLNFFLARRRRNDNFRRSKI